MTLLSTKARYLLFPLALFYWGVIFWRNLFYTIGFFVTRRLPVSVISVGNISVGGTGKTSMVIYLAQELQKRGLKIAIVSRGYRRKTTGTKLVTDGNRVSLPWEESGDEPYLMAHRLTGIPIVVDENRYRGGLYVVENFTPDIILLDDAFQHRSINRNLDIVLLNSNDPPDAYKLLPYGKLREPWYHLRRADLIFWTKSNLKRPHPTLQNKIPHTGFPALTSRLEPDRFLRDGDHNSLSLDHLKGKRVLAFCGIADPESFLWLLRKVGAETVYFKPFEDHYMYNEEDMRRLVEEGEKRGANLFITTEKDLFKVTKWMPEQVTLYSIGVQFIPSKEGEKVLMDTCLKLRRRPGFTATR